MKKVLITGGAGYIGSHTVIAVKEAGYEPVIVDNFSNASEDVLVGLRKILGEEVVIHTGDCKDEKFLNRVFLQERQLLGAIHFAAYKSVSESVYQPLKYYENNIGALLTLLKMMHRHRTEHLVFSSSCTVYGEPALVPVTEEAPLKPAVSPYGHTKQIGEAMIRDEVKGCQQNNDSQTRNLKAVALRYFNPIGAHASAYIGEQPIGKPNNLIPLVTRTAMGLQDRLTVFGNDYDTPDGTCIRDYIHVSDLAEAHVKALQFLELVNQKYYFDAFNIGTGYGKSVLEVIRAFEEVSKLKLNYQVGARRPGDVEKVYAHVEKSVNTLKWSPKRSIERAIADAWQWQKELSKK